MAQLYLPSDPPGSERLVTRGVLVDVLRAMVTAWEPDWAVATPRALGLRVQQLLEQRAMLRRI